MKDYDYIKKKFDEDGLEVPESLDSEQLRRKLEAAALEDGAPTPAGDSVSVGDSRSATPAGRRRWKKPLIGLAACACLALAIVPMAVNKDPLPDYNYLQKDENGLYTFASDAQLDRTVKQIVEGEQNCPCYVRVDDNQLSTVEDAEAPAASDGVVSLAENSTDTTGEAQKSSGSNTPSHSDTYTQVEDVDEADIVKTDGKYIYHVSHQENQVIITRAENGETQRVSSVGEKGDTLIRDIYVTDNKLIVISDARIVHKKSSYGNEGAPSTAVTVYDISDPAKPKSVGSYSQTGNLLSSRMSGSRVILVTNQSFYNVDGYSCKPFITFGKSEAIPVEPEDIRCVPTPSSVVYTTVGLIDTSKGKLSQDRTRTSALLGGSEHIYCNTTDLFIASDIYKLQRPDFFSKFSGTDEPLYYQTSESTQLVRVSLKKGKVEFKATGEVDGTVNNQFSMDASKGNFRIATTSLRDDHDVNNLFVLDDDFNEVGSLRNFARDEHIEAVRYIDDRAYVITYEQTDPLFIIDLSKPSEPVIKGHVKITGFSTLLVPVDKDHILGFGFSTKTTEFGEATDGLKLALFDVSDPSNPKVADSKEYPKVSSPIQYDHKALLVGQDEDYYALPYTVYPGSSPEYGIMSFDARGGNLKSLEKFTAESQVNRCIYIGDYIYGITWDDSIESFPIEDLR